MAEKDEERYEVLEKIGMLLQLLDGFFDFRPNISTQDTC